MVRTSVFLAVVYLWSAPLFAQAINDTAIRQEGYGKVADVLAKMTPQQRIAVQQEAARLRADMQRMSPEERRRLIAEMDRVYVNTDFSAVKPEAYDPQKHRLGNLPSVRQDLRRVGQ